MSLLNSLPSIAAELKLTDIAGTIATAALVGFWHEMRAFREEIRLWRAKIDTTLFGPEGNNGLNGKSKEMEHRIHDLEHSRNGSRS